MTQESIFPIMSALDLHYKLLRWEIEGRARAEGRDEVRRSVMQKLLDMGIKLEDAEKITGLTISTES